VQSVGAIRVCYLPSCRAAMVRPGKSRKEPQMKKTTHCSPPQSCRWLRAWASPQTATPSPRRTMRRTAKRSSTNTRTAESRGALRRRGLDTSVAINQCRDGNPGPAIPVLERRLRGNGFTVPPRQLGRAFPRLSTCLAPASPSPGRSTREGQHPPSAAGPAKGATSRWLI